MASTLADSLTPASLEVARKVLLEELAREKAGKEDLSRARTVEVELYRKDGSTFWSEVTVTFLRDPDGQPFGLLGISRDISERRRTQEVLKAERDRAQGYLDVAAVMLVVMDADGNIALLKMASEFQLIDSSVAEKARSAYREYRRTQHMLRLNNAQYARVPPERFAAEIAAVQALRRSLFGA